MGTLEVLDKIVRPVVTLLFAGAIVIGWLFFQRLSDDAFLGLAGMVIGFWFQQRQSAKENGGKP